MVNQPPASSPANWLDLLQVVGVHSLATGQLVAEINLQLVVPPAQFSCMDFWQVDCRHGSCTNSGRHFLGVVPAGSSEMHVFRVGGLPACLPACLPALLCLRAPVRCMCSGWV
jgi:hypothetical protein